MIYTLSYKIEDGTTVTKTFEDEDEIKTKMTISSFIQNNNIKDFYINEAKQSSPTIICISGKAQNGKDTSASIFKIELEKLGKKVLVIHYADYLKFICTNYFMWDGKKDETGRALLQKVGTDIVRKKVPDFWVDSLISVINLFPGEWDYIIIPDTRFPNEINKLKSNLFKTIHVRVKRKNFNSPLTKEQQSHPSETALDETKYDYLITNVSAEPEGTPIGQTEMDNLTAQINKIIQEIIKK